VERKRVPVWRDPDMAEGGQNRRGGEGNKRQKCSKNAKKARIKSGKPGAGGGVGKEREVLYLGENKSSTDSPRKREPLGIERKKSAPRKNSRLVEPQQGSKSGGKQLTSKKKDNRTERGC